MSLKSAALSLLFSSAILAQTVTITKDIPSREHPCIRHCLFRPYNANTDLGDVLECAPPYEENCYCPSDEAKAEIASRHIDACATEQCSRGDLTQDIDKMRAHYATYCVEKGYTADVVEEWYSALETVASTTTSEGEETTTTVEEESTATDEEEVTTTASESDEGEATTSEPASTEASTTEDNAAATTVDDGRNPDGLPSMDFEGDDDDGALAMSPGMLLALVPLLAVGALF